jgi:putative oxidoreductase
VLGRCKPQAKHSPINFAAMIKKLFSSKALKVDLASLVLRVTTGFFMAYGHGWPKVLKWDILIEKFSGPFGMPPSIALPLVIFAEVICSGLIIAGLFTRFAAIPNIIAMIVAAFYAHAGDSLIDREGSLTYLAAFIVIFFLGSGKYSLDKTFFKR